MRTLTIDIGTNSTLYLIADVANGELTLIERGIEANGLGSTRTAEGVIPQETISKNEDILSKIAARGRALSCVKVIAAGTQALRSAVNADQFIEAAALVGVPVRIISPEEEARLGWLGVFGHNGSGERTALLDIGGGSSELTIGKGNDIECSSSIPIGAVSVASGLSNDPPSSADVERAADVIRASFAHWKGLMGRGVKLVGIAGTMTAVASLESKLAEYSPGALEGYKLELGTIAKWRSRLVRLPLDQRQALAGMPPARAGVIPAGVLILVEAMRILGKRSILVSDRGVMFGVALDESGG